MFKIISTPVFDKWLKNINVRIKILARLARLENGNFGDYKKLADKLYELRFSFGGGLRIYYAIHNQKVILLLNGGNKSTQSRDIKKARKILAQLE